MTSAAKNIVAGVLAVAAILGVAALFVSVTRSRGSREGELEKEEERAGRAAPTQQSKLSTPSLTK